VPGGTAPPGAIIWNPDKAPTGPVSIIISTADAEVYVYCNGIELGRPPVGGLPHMTGYYVYSALATVDFDVLHDWPSTVSVGGTAPNPGYAGRGVADKPLTRLRTPSHTHEPRQQELTRLVLPRQTQRLAASAQPPRVNRGFSLAALEWAASLRLPPLGAGPGRWRKRCAFPGPQTLPPRANAAILPMSTDLFVPTQRNPLSFARLAAVRPILASVKSVW